MTAELNLSSNPVSVRCFHVALIFKGIENKEIVEKYYGNLYDLVGTAGGMFRIILLISGFLVGLISSIKFKEYMVNDFYSLIDQEFVLIQAEQQE